MLYNINCLNITTNTPLYIYSNIPYIYIYLFLRLYEAANCQFALRLTNAWDYKKTIYIYPYICFWNSVSLSISDIAIDRLLLLLCTLRLTAANASFAAAADAAVHIFIYLYILYNISPEIAANCFWEPILFLAPVQCCHCDSVQFLYSLYTHYINIYKYSNSQFISSLSLSLSVSLAVYIDCFCVKGSANQVQYALVQDCQPVSVRVQLS